jgi:anti-anti-sigma factor
MITNIFEETCSSIYTHLLMNIMRVKIDTKEKFTVIHPEETGLTGSLTANLAETCKGILTQPVKNVVLNLESVLRIDEASATILAELQQHFYEQNTSFVVCGLRPEVEASFESAELLEFMNITPTESEAWDIVQMEEIERELLDSDDMEFDKQPE